MRIIALLFLSVFIISCSQQSTEQIPEYYQEISEYNQIGVGFDGIDFVFKRENELGGFKEFIRIDDERYFQEVMILMNGDKTFNAVFIHKEPLDTISETALLDHFQDLKQRISTEFGELQALQSPHWDNVWLCEMNDETDEDALGGIMIQLDQTTTDALLIVVYMSQRFLDDNREVFQGQDII